MLNHKISYYIAALIGAALFFSCENDPKEVDELTDAQQAPTNFIVDMDMVYTDSGRVSSIIRAPRVVMDESDEEEGSIRRFPEGIEIISYEKQSDSQDIRLIANSAIFYDKSGMAEANGNVKVFKGQTDSLMTEKLIWDRKKKIFYSDDFTKVVQDGSILIGRKGFKANEDFSYYEFFNSEGEINIKDSLQ